MHNAPILLFFTCILQLQVDHKLVRVWSISPLLSSAFVAISLKPFGPLSEKRKLAYPWEVAPDQQMLSKALHCLGGCSTATG